MTQGPPSIKAVQAKRKSKCGHHPRYSGKNPPRVACPICWGMYLAEKYDMKPENVLAPEVVYLNDLIDIGEFITGLKSAASRSKETGGAYSAFAHTKAGKTFQVEVHLPMRRKK